MEPNEFFEKYGMAAVRATLGTTQLPSVILAQAAIESGWNTSGLSKQYNNFFGYKVGSGWSGQSVNLSTREWNGSGYEDIKDNFRVYASAEDSIIDRVRLIERLHIYAPVRQAATAQAQADALQACGYATAPDYADTIKKLIRSWDLEKYDKKKSR